MARDKRRESATSETAGAEDGKKATGSDANTAQDDNGSASMETPETEMDPAKQETDLSNPNEASNDKSGKKSPPEINEEDLQEFASKPISSAIDGQREAQKAAFHNLIEENVKLGREKKRAEVDLYEMVTRYDLKVIELDDERTKVEKLEARVRSMEKDMKMMAIAAKQASGKSTRKRSTSLKQDEDETGEPDQKTNYSNLNQNNNAPDKLKDLQQRLIRLAKDDEEKDRSLDALREDNERLRVLLTELEDHVGSDKVKEIEQEIAKREENKKKEEQTNMVYGKGVVNKAEVKESKVCAIM